MDPRIIQLIARKLSGEATTEEISELDQLLTRNPEAVYYAELISQLWSEEKIPGSRMTLTDTDLSYLRHLARHRPVFRRRMAPRPEPPARPAPSAGNPLPTSATSAPDLFPSSRLRVPQRVWWLFLVIGTAVLLYIGIRIIMSRE